VFFTMLNNSLERQLCRPVLQGEQSPLSIPNRLALAFLASHLLHLVSQVLPVVQLDYLDILHAHVMPATC
jgi:hypothetical protein